MSGKFKLSNISLYVDFKEFKTMLLYFHEYSANFLT